MSASAHKWPSLISFVRTLQSRFTWLRLSKIVCKYEISRNAPMVEDGVQRQETQSKAAQEVLHHVQGQLQ